MKQKSKLTLLVFTLISILWITFGSSDAVALSGIDYPFPGGEEWAIINGYNDGYLHGSEIWSNGAYYDYYYAYYALDFAKSAGSSAGSPVFLPTNIYAYRRQGSANKCIDLALPIASGSSQFYIEICHVDIDSNYSAPGVISEGFLPKGTYLGTVASDCPNCNPAHIHMAIHLSPISSPWTEDDFYNDGFARLPFPYMEYANYDLSLNGDQYPPEAGLWNQDNDPMNQHDGTTGLFSNQLHRDDPSIPAVGGYQTDPNSGGSYGDDPVDIREDAGCISGQYGWHDPTGDYFNITGYMEDRTSCVAVDPGWSVMIYEHANGQGGSKCLNHTVTDLQHTTLNNGTNANDVISSVQVYHDTNCGGQMPQGLADGDTVTIHVDQYFASTRWGVHDIDWWNIPDYTQDQVSSIGVTPGWSALVYESPNRTQGAACFIASDQDLADNFFYNGEPVNNNIESMQVFYDTNCGGWAPPASPSPTPSPTPIPSPTPTPSPSVIPTPTPTPSPTPTLRLV